MQLAYQRGRTVRRLSASSQPPDRDRSGPVYVLTRSSLGQRGRYLGRPRPARPASDRRRLRQPDRYQLRLGELTGICGLPEWEVQTALRALANTSPSLLRYPRPPEELSYPIIITDVTERAWRLVGQWPTADSLAAKITKALSEAAEHESDPTKRLGCAKQYLPRRDRTRCGR
jgi:hypothetical protein